MIKDLRIAAGLTQQQLADKVRVTVRTINSIEREQYSPSLMLAYRIAQLFGCNDRRIVLSERKSSIGGKE